MGNRTLGLDPQVATGADNRDDDDVPGPWGVTPLKAGDRIVTTVTKDWDPLTVETTPEIFVNGRTLADVENDLNTRDEWGQGGGGIPQGPVVPFGTSPTVSIDLKGKFVRILPTWRQYGSASAAAKAEWDQMVAQLTIHEDRHVAIAVEECDKLATDLVGKEIGQIAGMITAMGRRIRQRQDKLDHDTDHGAKVGVQYGDVKLDTTIK